MTKNHKINLKHAHDEECVENYVVVIFLCNCDSFTKFEHCLLCFGYKLLCWMI